MAQKQTLDEKGSTGGISMKTVAIAIAVGLILSIASVWFGYADEGSINVTEVIDRSNAASQGDVAGSNTSQPRNTNNARSNLPNGGLVGTGAVEAQRPAPEPEVESASSTEERATTTESESSDIEETQDSATTTVE